MKNRGIICAVIFLMIVAMSSYVGFCFYFSVTTDNTSNALEKSVSNEDTSYVSESKNEEEKKTGSLNLITSYTEFNDVVSSTSNKMIVLGRKNCHYCEKYYPILESITASYNIDIYYIDMASLESADKESILASNITIPAKCNDEGTDVPLSYGFGTPLTLFTSSSQTYDCIRGYKEETYLINYLKQIGYIEKEN